MKPPGPYLLVVPERGDDDPEIERYLGAARELAEPDASSRARVARALNAALPPSAPLPAFGANTASPASSPVTLASAARLHAPWLAVGAIVIGGLGFGLGWTLGRSEPTAPSATQAALSPSPSPRLQLTPQASLPSAPAPAATDPSSEGVAVSSPTLADEGAGTRPPAPKAGLAVAAGAARAARAARSPASPATQSPRRNPPAALAAPESSPASLDFRQALERLRRARTQLEQGHATASLLLLSELDRDAGELLLEEREATRVLALCATGETLAARASAERLAQRSPRSIYLRRLAASCIEDADRDAPAAESAF